MSRADRERAAYDEGDVWEQSHRWHARFPHVFQSPNTLRHESLFDDLLSDAVPGRDVLEVGCGAGETAEKLLGLGARRVVGVDVSERFLAKAKARTVAGRLEFANHDVAQPFDGQFDVITGRSILHHVDYREVTRRLYADTLRPGGVMVFMEPLGSHPLIRLFTLLVPRAHTPDERSFSASDLGWFRRQFDGFMLYPYDLASLPAAMVSSFVFSSPDNALLRIADRMDRAAANRARFLTPYFRHAIFVIRKTGSA